MILLAQQNGAGPIVSLSMGLGSAPASIADAPEVSSVVSTDMLLLVRAGVLNLVPYAALSFGSGSALTGGYSWSGTGDLILDLADGAVTLPGFAASLKAELSGAITTQASIWPILIAVGRCT